MKDLTQFKSLNVLYVDDDPKACQMLKKILTYYFAEVYISTSAAEAMEIYKKGRCNLLLVDYDMPIMNGADFLRDIRKSNSKIPAVIISSYDDKEKLFDAIELQLISYLVKPYSMEELKEVFYKTLEWMDKKGLLEFKIDQNSSYSYATKKLYIEDKEIALSPSEFKILETLIGNENTLVSYELLKSIVGENCTHKSLVNQVHKLKKKLNIDIIKNVKDFGYIFTR